MRWIVLGMALGLAGCAGAASPTVVGADGRHPAPSNARALAAAHVRDVLLDPASIRNARVSRVWYGGPPLFPGWVVCVKADGRGRLDHAVTQQTLYLVFRGDVVVQSERDNLGAFCTDETFGPFPEVGT